MMKAGTVFTATSTPRRLSFVLLRVTLLLTVLLGTIAAAVQMWTDLRQEKDGVELSATEFLESATPAAANAAYNFYDDAAEQVVAGLFTHRAIAGVTIVNEGEVMITRRRDITPTLPTLGGITASDEVTLRRALNAPAASGETGVIGELSIIVDRSAVPPAIVNRLFSYFLLSVAKNILLGCLLIALVYATLAGHIVALAEAAARWKPGRSSLDLPSLPKLLAGTEVELLGDRVRHAAETANEAINEIAAARDEVEKTNRALNEKSVALEETVKIKTRDLRRANEKLQILAERDGLTGLYNRRYFDRHATDLQKETVSSGHALFVLLIDVDHFKAFNDFYGHLTGDEALEKIAGILRDIAKDTRCLVARYGGEEFIMLAREDDVPDPEGLAVRLHTALEAENIEHQRSSCASRVTVSIGIAASVRNGRVCHTCIDSLISSADEALYEAKRLGRNRTLVSTNEIRNRVRAQRLAARSLLEAIEERCFEPFFQPQIDVRTGELIGAEALVRWRRGDGKVSSPAAFMDTAGDSGLVPLIDRIMLDKVSDFVRTISKKGLVLPRVSINLTRDAMASEDVIDAVVALARHSETQIAVELLETAFTDAPDQMFMWQLDRLRDGGVQIEIDDFGTGRTSILGLMSIGPDRLKIAREIVLPLTERPRQKTVVRAVLEIARALDIEVLSEGVETAEIADALAELDCPLQQGYFHARAKSGNAFMALLPLASELGSSTQPASASKVD